MFWDPLEDLFDEEVEGRVERAKVSGGDSDEDDRDSGGLHEGVAIRPLDLFQLGPAGGEEADHTAALAIGLRLFLLFGELLALAALLLGPLALLGFLRRLRFGALIGPGGLGRVGSCRAPISGAPAAMPRSTASISAISPETGTWVSCCARDSAVR